MKEELLEEVEQIIKDLCQQIESSQGKLVRIDVVEKCLLKKLEKLKEQNNGQKL